MRAVIGLQGATGRRFSRRAAELSAGSRKPVSSVQNSTYIEVNISGSSPKWRANRREENVWCDTC
jgi:hypothetical protein